MTLWIILTIMSSAAAVLVSAALIRRLDDRRAGSPIGVEVYRDQLAEVDREATEGLIDADQAEAARVEIKRRLLAIDGAARSSAPLSLSERKFALVAVTAIVVLGSVGLYALNGRPELSTAIPSRPVARAPEPSVVDQLAAATQIPASQDQPQSQPQTPLASVDEMVERLAARLKLNPNDPDGWRMLGWSYLRTEHFADAAAAYRKAVELSPNVASLRSSLAEALVKAADGQVTTEAKAVLADVLTLDPKDPAARYFMALAKAQAGDKAAAVNDWIALLDDAGANDSWTADVMETATEFGREIGVDVSSRLHRPSVANTGGILPQLRKREAMMSRQTEKGPAPEDIRNADAMAPADRMAMIRGMVEGLATRLDQSPRDVEGWIKLIRSRTVLGETESARQALDRALKVFGDAPQEQERIAEAGRQLGLTK
jgi:cytochrome c-type biogenesis protein CcmH